MTNEHTRRSSIYGRCLPGPAETLNPKSEIETGNLPQSLGHKQIEKSSTDHFGYASIFSIRFCSKILRHLAGLNFGFRAKWIIAAGLVGLFWVIGNIIGAFASLFQGFQSFRVPLPLRSRLLIGYGPLAIRIFGLAAAAAWVYCDVHFRGQWLQWFLFALFVALVSSPV